MNSWVTPTKQFVNITIKWTKGTQTLPQWVHDVSDILYGPKAAVNQASFFSL